MPRNIDPVRISPDAFTGAAPSLPAIPALDDGGQKKYGNSGKAENSSGQREPVNIIDNTTKSSEGKSDSSPGIKQNPHWLNSTDGSLNNLTRDDQLYTSWTGHLDTPRAIDLNSSAVNGQGNRPDTQSGASKVYGNLSGDHIDKAKGTAQARIAAMLEKVGTVQAYTQNTSSLTADQKLRLLAEADKNARWLSGKAAEIVATDDVNSAQGLLGDTESGMSLMEADIQRNMGLLACNELDYRISEALNASLALSERLDRMNLGDADRVIAKQYLTDCREHLLNASLYSDSAAQSFQSIDGQAETRDNYRLGLEQLQQSKTELNLAYLAINKIFHETVDNTNI
ncbi:hypothetical protein [Methanocella sp. MCL-LM]|uniref:hypothetical protein n=1 Tax=Methanocella sp. MCL-LM TaxID=3412035 RepID=UPI003C761C6B